MSATDDRQANDRHARDRKARDRQERLAAQLRANLRRRKAQGKRMSDPQAGTPGACADADAGPGDAADAVPPHRED